MLRALDQFVEHHGDGTEYDDGGDHHVELEETQGLRERDRHAWEYAAFLGLTDFLERSGVIVFCGRILYNIF